MSCIKMRLIGTYVPVHTIFHLAKEKTCHRHNSLILLMTSLQEPWHLSLEAGGSRAYTESVSSAWSLAKFAEFGRVKGQRGYRLGCSTLLNSSVGKYSSNVCFKQSIYCAKLLPRVLGAPLSPDSFAHETGLLGKQPQHAWGKEQIVTYATGEGAGQKEGCGKQG